MFEASLGYRESSRIAKAIQRHPVSKTKGGKKNHHEEKQGEGEGGREINKCIQHIKENVNVTHNCF